MRNAGCAFRLQTWIKPTNPVIPGNRAKRGPTRDPLVILSSSAARSSPWQIIENAVLLTRSRPRCSMGPGSARLCRLAGMTRRFCEKTEIFIPALPNLIYSCSSVLPTGNAVRDGVSWGRTGASVLRLTWQQGRGGSVQGFPCGHYGPCVLDEHIGGTGEGRPPACRDDVRRKCLDIATAGTEQRNGREQKSPDGRPQGRMFT